MAAPILPIAFLILQAATQITEDIQAGLAQRGFIDVRPVHGFVFVRVSAGNASNADIASYLGVSKQAASQLIDQLVRLGYVQRRPRSTDARSIVIELTARGRECTQAAEAAVADIELAWKQRLGASTLRDVEKRLGEVVRPMPLRPSW